MALDDVVRGWLARPALWGCDLNEVPGLSDALIQGLHAIRAQGLRRLLAG